MKLYVLTVDGYTRGYGSYIYLVGVFDSMKKAEEAQNTLDKEIREDSSINEISLNEVAELTEDHWGDFANRYLLGGYHE